MSDGRAENDHPLWMPEGSVRSIIALGLVGAYIGGLIDVELVGVAVGFYFGARKINDG